MSRTVSEIIKDLEGYEKPACPSCGESVHVTFDSDGFFCEACPDPSTIPNGQEWDDTLEELRNAQNT